MGVKVAVGVEVVVEVAVGGGKGVEVGDGTAVTVGLEDTAQLVLMSNEATMRDKRRWCHLFIVTF